jgi:sec-independent protein translocase protein TatA
MFGIGMPELAVIMVIALLVLGPKRLPEVARNLGRAMAEFRRQSSEIMDELQSQTRIEEDRERERRTGAAKAAPVPTPAANTVAATPTAPPTDPTPSTPS